MSDFKKQLKKMESTKLARVPLVKIKPEKGLREDSLNALEELVQCGICLEKLVEPRMLPCQHTFCLSCLKTVITTKNLKLVGGKLEFSDEVKSIHCPICKADLNLNNGFESLNQLPKNFQAEAILKLLEGETNPSGSKVIDYRCVKCQTISEKDAEHVCQHCMQIFCSICWISHISELDSNLNTLIEQIEHSRVTLNHKRQNYAERCDQLTNTIEFSIQQKIEKLKKMEENVLLEVAAIKEQGNILHDMINTKVDNVRAKLETIMKDKQSKNKVSNYMNIHRETAKLFDEIYQYGEARIVFDAEKIRIDQDKEGVYNDLTEKENVKEEKVENPFENISSMIKHYKSRSFVPRLLWTKCPRPGGVGISPWDTSKIYVAATDSHNILVLDRYKFKLIRKINNPEMLCPTNLAFSKKYEEMFVTDKWKHCIHVFSSDSEYMKCFTNLQLRSPDGIAVDLNDNLVICDTGNNRILVVNADNGNPLYTVGTGQLHIPTSVAIHGENIYVADTGNNRIKIFNKDGQCVQDIGTFGRNKGEFRSAEIVAVDCLGFILVGDAGNARIQVFTPDGKFVRIFGSKEGFAWISGIHITPELDIICTDNKNRSLRIF